MHDVSPFQPWYVRVCGIKSRTMSHANWMRPFSIYILQASNRPIVPASLAEKASFEARFPLATIWNCEAVLGAQRARLN
jgi:hypothetical protein